MGLGSIGVPGLILILVVALLLFGPNKLPELGRAFGKTLREFKKGTRELMEDDKPTDQEQVAKIEDNGKKERRLPD